LEGVTEQDMVAVLIIIHPRGTRLDQIAC